MGPVGSAGFRPVLGDILETAALENGDPRPMNRGYGPRVCSMIHELASRPQGTSSGRAYSALSMVEQMKAGVGF